ncbi:MAG: helix-turn-helix domain-containing protein [Erysipelotrichaceae bacterium]|nr:helix-turn-helix domain-containing protein [Erysipelotrichaceae bacterium]
MVSIDLERTGRHLRALMAEKGLNPKRVGEIMGLEYNAPYKWVWGKCLPNAEHLLELSELLEVSIEEMIIYERR